MKKSELPEWCKVGGDVIRFIPGYARYPQTAEIVTIDKVTSAGVIVAARKRFHFPTKRGPFNPETRRYPRVIVSLDYAVDMDAVRGSGASSILPANGANLVAYKADIQLRDELAKKDAENRAKRQRDEAERNARDERHRAALDSLLFRKDLTRDQREAVERVRKQFGEIV